MECNFKYRQFREKIVFFLQKWYRRRVLACEQRRIKFANKFYSLGGGLISDVKYR